MCRSRDEETIRIFWGGEKIGRVLIILTLDRSILEAWQQNTFSAFAFINFETNPIGKHSVKDKVILFSLNLFDLLLFKINNKLGGGDVKKVEVLCSVLNGNQIHKYFYPEIFTAMALH